MTGTMMPLHRQISEVMSITHSGYLFKRSNRPYQQVSPFPLDHLEIAVDTRIEGAIETEITPTLHPMPYSTEDGFLRASLANFSDSNGDNCHPKQPLNFPDPVVSLAARFQGTHDQVAPEPVPMVPLLPLDITGSISTKATEHEEVEEAALSEVAQARKRQLALEESLNSAAAFFGINVDSAFFPPSQTQTPSNSNISNGVTPSPRTSAKAKGQTPTEQRGLSPPPTCRSVPIKVNLKRDSQSSFDRAAMHRRVSAPCAYDSNVSPAEDGALTSNRSRPTDYVDPKDGHLWRAKYCVLEDGILYFYRNAEDADSQEAKTERQITDPFAEDSSQHRASAADSKDLSKSPMASRSLVNLAGADSPTSGSPSGTNSESSFMWEKRVALNCVGAVRSAETEFGANAFELLADDEDDERYTNKLVLKAPKQEEMNEWLFQFHRSLASFVKNVVNLVGAASPTYALGDIHHPNFDHDILSRNIQTPIRSFNLPAYSPRFVKHLPTPSPAALSHGHGRTTRRRIVNKGGGLSTASVHSVPNTPMSQSPTQFPFPPSNVALESNLVTPLNNGDFVSPPQDLKQPPNLQKPKQQEDSHIVPPAEEERTTKEPEITAPKCANPPETDRPPAPAKGGKYVPPHLRKKKYVPPHLRKKDNGSKDADGGSGAKVQKYVSPSKRNKSDGMGPGTEGDNDVKSLKSPVCGSSSSAAPPDKDDKERPRDDQGRKVEKKKGFKLGGCADPQVIAGSILDQQFRKRKSSRVGKIQTNDYGGEGGGNNGATGSASLPGSASHALQWEIGAVSECGVRDSNEDAYLIANDLLAAFGDSTFGSLAPTCWDRTDHQSALFAIFDGHCGNEAARYAAEHLPQFLYGESIDCEDTLKVEPALTEQIMRRAISKLDDEFCRTCVEDGRDWDSGSTALIAMLANEHLVIASIGDCRGVLCRLVEEGATQHKALSTQGDWNELPAEDGGASGQKCFWMDVVDVHNPSRPDEKERIQRAGGWTTTEKEIPVSQLQRMYFSDEDVRDILQRCFQINDCSGQKKCSSAPQRILEISRVCGELAVSRAIGDRDFKAACNMSPTDNTENDGDNESWECQLFLPYPDNHSRRFVGDLVSGQPDFQSVPVGESGMEGEFLLLACDGLWDVMDMDDAVRVTRSLLFEKDYPAKQAAARLAELAGHLGSSDNITVIVVRFRAKAEQ